MTSTGLPTQDETEKTSGNFLNIKISRLKKASAFNIVNLFATLNFFASYNYQNEVFIGAYAEKNGRKLPTFVLYIV